MRTIKMLSTCCCCVGVGFIGLFSFLGTPEEKARDAVGRFVRVFQAGDAVKLKEIIHPDIAEGKEVKKTEAEAFLRRFKSRKARIETVSIDPRPPSKDGKTKRFESALSFRVPEVSKEYRGDTKLEMTLLWVLEKKKWWLERPLSVNYRVTSNVAYPTARQNQVALQFQTALDVLARLGLVGKEDLPFGLITSPGSAWKLHGELEKLHKKEQKGKGIAPTASGVQVFLRAAGCSSGGFLQSYHEDFKHGGKDRRKPVPWDMFRDYAEAAIKYGHSLERKSEYGRAERVYRLVISLGRQILDEPGGLQFVNWGLTFEGMGAGALARLQSMRNSPEAATTRKFAKLVARRWDLLQTALTCLDDMQNYNSLKAAIIAATRARDPIFRPWGINTLAIFAAKGAPANKKTVKSAGALVLVDNPAMQETASQALERVIAQSRGKVKSFAEHQKKWVRGHRVYGVTHQARN